MAKKQAAGGLISPTNLWGKPLPTTKQSPLKKSSEEVTGKMTDSDDVMDDEEIDVDAELANADVEDEELVEAEAEEDSEVTSELAGDANRAVEAHAEAAFLAGRAEDALKQFDSLKQRDDVDYVQRARVEARMAEIMPVVLEMRRAGLRPEDQGRERRS